MENRKYFKQRIVELELVFKNADGNCAVLEELEEELSYRSTQRARKLLVNVQKTLHSDHLVAKTVQNFSVSLQQESLVNNNTLTQEDAAIDWNRVVSADTTSYESSNETIEENPLSNHPADILDAWTVLEALSPQTYKKPNDLIIGTGSVAYLQKVQEPWFTGEMSRPRNNLYYAVYLGALDMNKTTAQLLSVYQDKRFERSSVNGLAAMGVILLDKKGIPIPETGLALSSFGWAYARALQGKLAELKSWGAAEEILKEGLDKIIYKQDESGNVQPFSLEKAKEVYHWLLRNCEIPESDARPPSFAIRMYRPFSKGEPEAPLLNSFFLDDLQRAKHAVQRGDAGKALSQYLGIIKLEDEYDVLTDKRYIEKALQPKYMPVSRWPGKGRHALVLLQQTAVNLAMQKLKTDGLISVNGPPGTGKTTLLRDVVASVLVERAKALYAFKNTDDAFEHAGQMKLGNGFVHLYKLHESLRGHEILVASTNNKAVENVSKELPLRSQLAQDIEGFNYFNVVSNALSEDNEETWGLVAAVLGNSKNRNQFINKAWWDDESGLRKYFLSITRLVNYDIDDNGEEIIPKIIQECNPPTNLPEAKQRWEEARKEFNKALKSSEEAISLAQKAYKLDRRLAAIKEEVAQNETQQTHQGLQISSIQQRLEALSKEQANLNVKLVEITKKKKCSHKNRPWFWKWLLTRKEWKTWKDNHTSILTSLEQLQYKKLSVSFKVKENQSALADNQKTLSNLKEEQHSLHAEQSKGLVDLEKFAPLCGGKLVTPDLWIQSHENQQNFTPNFTCDSHRLRDDVFIAAVKLHKAFIDASAKQMLQNLGVFFSCLGGGSLPQDKQALLPHLWSSAFLLTPVMSTAFASVGRMLKPMPKESIGWLLIDEAGQATPQAAIGAIYRARRVMSVGDPLQIEPVVTLTPSLVEGISKYMGVDPYQWMAPNASVQTVSDKANSFGTTIPRDLSEIRIGLPLLVHRRCENPMFSISNNLAYNGLMVHATVSIESEITGLFQAQSAWFDIKGSAEEKWCPEEGNHVCDMLLRSCSLFSADPDIFVITPFRNVAYRMRQRMEMETGRLEMCGIEDPNSWINNNIGTVHTFQGKEARAVILLLGAPSPTQNGARGWATSNVNLLNVAVSRAKQNFYVVGNKELWGELGHMKLVSRYL